MRSTRRLLAAVVVLSSVASAQQYVIFTVAGGAPPPTPATAIDISIGAPSEVATDGAGNIYFASAAFHSVFQLDPNGVLMRVAGNSRAGYSGDGGPATGAQLWSPTAVAVDGEGNLFIADGGNNRIRKVLPSGIITTVAGIGTPGFSGDGGPAIGAQLGFGLAGVSVGGVVVDGAGNLFIADVGNGRIRKVSTDGIITTVAGNGGQGFSGDGGPAISAQLLLGGCCGAGVAVDHAGSLFIADDGNNRIRKVSPDGIITTVAGNGTFGFSGDNGLATGAQLSFPVGVAVDGADNLFIVQYGAVRKVSTSGIISTVAGNGVCCGFSGDGGPATSAQVNASSVAVDSSGNLIIGDSGNHRIRKVSANGVITTVAGNGMPDFSGDGGPATSARLAAPAAIAADDAGNLFITESDSSRVRKISPDGVITTVAGSGTGDLGDGGPATSANLSLFGCNSLCGGVAVDHSGNLFIADPGHGRIRKVSKAGIISTVAGGGTDVTGREGAATSAALIGPYGLAVDSTGNLFIAESFDNDRAAGRIRKVTPDGIITTVAGGGTAVPGDNGLATNARLGLFIGVAVDGTGNLFITDSSCSCVRKVSTNGIITTVAGNGTGGFSGDGGPATSAQFSWVWDIAVDASGNLFIGDYNRIRKVSSDGIITTIAGNGGYGFSGDGGPAISAQLGFLPGVVVDGAGNVYATDWYNNVVHVLRPTNQSLLIGSVVDAASQRVGPISPGKIVVIYGADLGPSRLIQNQATNGQFGDAADGTKVTMNGIPAPVLYTSSTQVAAIVPYEVTAPTAQVAVAYQGQTSNSITIPVEPSAPSLFTFNQTGAGQAAAINASNGSANTAANPVKIGGYISLYATGEGQTIAAGVDGKVGNSTAAHPLLSVKVTVGGIPATVQYSGGIEGQVAGLMQVNVQIPNGVQPGGYVPVILQVGNRSSSPAVWIAVAGN